MLVNPAKIKDETVKNLRDNGYMVIIFSPEEMGPVAADFFDIEDQAIAYINELIDDDKKEIEENDKEFFDDAWNVIGEDDLT